MPETDTRDVESEEVETEERFDDDLPPFEDEEESETDDVDTTDEDEEGRVEDSAEEAGDEAGEQPVDSLGAPDLSHFPEELRSQIVAFGEKQVANLKSEWNPKLEEAAEHRKTIEAFNARMREDPRGLAKEILSIAESGGWLKDEPPEPQDPGEMPDPIEDPQGAREWGAKLRRFQDFQAQKLVSSFERKIEDRLAPLEQMRQAQANYQQRTALQQRLKVDDDFMNEMLQESERLRKDPNYAWDSIRDRVASRRAAAAKKAKLQENGGVAEMRPGLPRTKARRQKPKPSGELGKDIAAELDFEGVPFPEGE